MTARANFNYPASYRIGCGRIAELSATCVEFGIARPLLVTDQGVAALDWFSAVRERLTDEGFHPTVYSDVHENPTEQDVTSGLRARREGGCDGVVLIGGGSPLDVGKCIALLADNPGSVFDYEDVGTNYQKADASRILPMIAVPTTSGTGSEVGRASVIIDENHRKKIIFHPRMQPPVVLADPELTFALPPHLTAFTGIDAFTHCFEAFCATGYHPMADGIALEGMRLIARALPRCFRDGSDAEARTDMMMASSMGATAFQKGLGVVHAIAHAIGGVHRVHHGMTNALLLPYCMQFNRSVIENRTAMVARHLELPTPSHDALLNWILTMRRSLGVPHRLADVPELEGLDPGALAPVAREDPALAGNPRAASVDELRNLIERARDGSLD